MKPRLLTYLATSLAALSAVACGSSSDGAVAAAGQFGTQGGSASGGSPADVTGGGGSAGIGGRGGGLTPIRGAAGGGIANGGAGPTTPIGDYAVASTRRGSCALDGTGVIQCWGHQPDPWTIPSGAFVELHGAVEFICAIRADRTVTCFDAPRPSGGNPSGVAALVPKGKVQTLTVDAGTICGTDDTGRAFCNSAYDLLDVPAGEDLSRVSVGSFFACGIRTANDTVTCWGNSGGDADCKIPALGQLLAPAGAFAAIWSSSYSSCALDKTGAVSCWGAGEAADDPTELCGGKAYNHGQSAPPSGTFRLLGVGATNACGIKTDGAVACWGAGTTDECQDIGDNCRQSRPPPGVFEQISVGNYHSCAMTADRKVQCWGYPGSGPTGDGRLAPPGVFQ